MHLKLTSYIRCFKKQIKLSTLAITTLLILAPANAQDTGGVCGTLTKFQGLLEGASVVVVTLAIMWAGYRFLFGRAEISECGKIVAAGVMIGSAGAIAGMLLGNSDGCDDNDLKVESIIFQVTELVAKLEPAYKYKIILDNCNEA